MNPLLQDQTTHWEPVDRAARLLCQPASEDDKLRIRTTTLMFDQSAAAKLALAGEHRFLQSGDRVGRLKFLGITMHGFALCRCDCGRTDTFPIEQVAGVLKPNPGSKRAKKLARLCCNDCLALQVAIHKAGRTGK